MNVTAVNQIVTNTQVSKKAELHGGTAFSQELKKHLTNAEESEADELTDDLSQSEVKSGTEKETEELEETNEFVIIPTFLRFDSELEHSSTVLTDLHKDKLYMDSTIAQESSIESVTSDEESIIAMPDLADSVSNAETVKASTEPILTTADYEKETAKFISHSETKTASIENTEVMPVSNAKDSPNEVTKEIDSANIFKVLAEFETERLSVEKAEGIVSTVKDSKPVKADFVKETTTAIENKQEQSLTQRTEANGQNERKIDIEAFNFQAGQQSEEHTETTAIEKSVNMKDNLAEEQLVVQQFGLSQSAQLKTVPEAVSQTTPLPVTTALEQSPEIIQDMMMSVSSNEAGETVYQSTLTLTPETLGDIKVELSYNNDGLTGNFIFETEDAKRYIESQWQQIKGPLEMKGIQLNGFDFQVVEPDTFAQSGNLNFSQQSDQSKKDQQDEHNGSEHSADRLEEETAGSKPVTRQESGLNYYA